MVSDRSGQITSSFDMAQRRAIDDINRRIRLVEAGVGAGGGGGGSALIDGGTAAVSGSTILDGGTA